MIWNFLKVLGCRKVPNYSIAAFLEVYIPYEKTRNLKEDVKMSDFIIAVGHTASGNVGCGVIDRLDESNCTREIGALALEYLKEKGHGVNLLRIDEGNKYSCEDCYLRSVQANLIAQGLAVDL